MHTFSFEKRTRVLFVVLALILGLVSFPSLADNGTAAYAEESSSGETEKIDLTVTTLEHARDKVPEDWNVWTGKEFGINTGFETSGANMNIPGAVFTLKIPKSPYLNKPKFTSSKAAQSSKQREDNDFWYMDYTFDPLRGGVFSTVTTLISFKNGITPPDTEIPIVWTLFDADKNVRETMTKKMVAKAKMDYKSIIRLQGSPLGNAGCQYRGATEPNGTRTYHCSYNVLEGNKAETTSDLLPNPGYITQDYCVAIRYNRPTSQPSGTGEYFGDTVKLSATLPEGATLNEHAKRVGWAYVPGSNNTKAEITRPAASLHAGIWGCGSDSRGLQMRLDFKDMPIKDGTAEKIYVATAEAVIDPGTVNYATQADYVKSSFGAVVFNRTGGISFNKSRSHGTNYVVMDGNLYREMERNDLSDDAREGTIFGYRIDISQRNNGSQPSGLASGGITNSVIEVVDKELDDRLYFRRVNVDYLAPVGNTVFNPQQVRQRFDAAQLHVYGVTSDGAEVKLSTNHLSVANSTGGSLIINDKTRKYEKLIFRFNHPFQMDNMAFRINVDVAPTDEELANWASEKYGTAIQRYKNIAELKYLNEGGSLESPEIRIDANNDNYMGIQGITPQIHQSLGSNTRLLYQNCEQELIEKGIDPTKLTPSNCSRVRTYNGTSQLTNHWGPYRGPMKNFKHIFLLPPGVNYVSTSNTSTQFSITPQNPLTPKIVPNYNNSGKTAVIYDYGDVNRLENGRFYLTTSLNLDTSLYVDQGPNVIDFYTVWDDMEKVKPYNHTSQKDVLDVNKNGNTEEKVLYAKVTTELIPPQELVVKNNISLDGNAWFINAPAQDLGSDIYYRTEARNASYSNLRNVSLMGTFPQENDHQMVANKDGLYVPRTWSYLTAEGNVENHAHSSYETPLTGPVVSVKAILDNVETNASDRVSIWYSTQPQGETIDAVRDSNWIPGEAVSDWSTIRNFKVVLKPDTQLVSGEIIQVITKHRIPYTLQTKSLPNGYKAVHSAANSLNGVTYSEANEVTSEIVKYKVKGTFFKDIDHNGSAGAGENGISGRSVVLVDGTTGIPAKHPDGLPITAETDAMGYYEMLVYKRGNYRVLFTKTAEETYTVVPTENNGVVNHVEKCHADINGESTPLDGATAAKCAEAEAKTNHLGYSGAFTLSPLTLETTVNAGVKVTKRDVIIKKVDQDGNLLNGIEFKLAWKAPLDGAQAPDPLPEAKTAVTGQKSDLDNALITEQKGLATFKDVPFGKYMLTEINVPEGIQGLTIPKEIIVSSAPLAVNQAGEAQSSIEILNTVVKATVVIRKVDADNPEKNLAGAEFELVSKNDPNLKYVATSGKNGLVTFSNVIYGDYTLHEKTAPTNYVKSEHTIDVQVREHGHVYALGGFPNTLKKGSVRLKKVDADTQSPLSGVVFELHQVVGGVKQDAVFATQTTDLAGLATFTGVPFGSYKLVEKTPAYGYLPLGRELDVNIDTDGQVVDFVTNPLTNTIKKSTVTLVKVDKDNPAKKLAGVTFKLYLKTAQGVATDPIDTVVTNGDGIATFNDVRFGTYVVRETATLPGYVLNATDREVNVTENGATIDLGTVENQFINGSVTVKKVNDDTPAKPLEGVVFGLYSKANGAVITDPAFEASTNEHGIATFAKVPFGIYELREKATIAGHNLNVEDTREIVIDQAGEVNDLSATPFVNTRIRGDVTVTKQDEHGNPLQGVTFSLFGAMDGNAVEPAAYTAVTGPDGKATFKRVLYGTYFLRETTPKEGYNPSAEIGGREIAVTTEGTEVSAGVPFVNSVITGTVKVTKVDAETPTVLLGGVEFGLYKKATDGSYPAAPTYTALTQADGVATFTGVAYGEYQLREITPLINYLPTAQTQQAVISKQDQEVVLATVTNTLKKGSVRLKKVDADTQSPLSGVVFELHQVVGGVKQDAVFATQTTDLAGLATFTGVPFGSYKLVEKTPANGYLPLGRELDVNIDTDGQVVDFVTNPLTNTIKKSTVTLVKVDKDNPAKKLRGVTFGLYAKSQNSVATTPTAIAETDANGVATFNDVRFGTYVVRETATHPGYVLNVTDREVNVTENGATIDLGTIENQFITGSVMVKKVDDDTPAKPLEGIVFGLYEKTNGTVTTDPAFEATTNEQGIAAFTKVPFGTYELREKATIEGYNLNPEDKREIVIDEAGEINDLTGNAFVNTRIRGDVEVEKHDTKGSPLSGVTFSLFAKAADGTVANTAAYTAITGTDGRASFKHVLYGTYILRETTPKEGFNPSTETKGREVSVAVEKQVVAAGEPFVNKVITGTVKVTKVDAETPTVLLGGVEFGLFKQDGDGNYPPVATYTALTGIDGVATFTEVEYGTYQLRELKPLINYLPTAQTQQVTIRTEGQEINLGTVQNTLKKGTVTLRKVDADDPKKPVANVQFVLKQGTEVKYRATSDATGNVTFTDVIYGQYEAVEVGAPENYTLNTTWKGIVNITADKQSVDLGEVANLLKKGSVKVTKFSLDDRQGLAGAHFALKQGDQTVHTGITNAAGELVFEKVVYGDYQLVETQAPAGYVLEATPIAVSVHEDGMEVNAGTVNNRAIRGSVTLTKVEDKSQKPLVGVEFELVDETDTVVATQTTDDSGNLTFRNVRYGNYTVREKSPLTGYVAHEKTYPVSIQTDKQTVALGKIENRKIISDIQVTKVDAQSQQPLAGVIFGLFPAADSFTQALPGEAVELTSYPTGFDLPAVPTYQAETDENGVAQFTGVEYGKWIVVELQPITGYNPSSETFGRLLTVENDGEVIKVAKPFENRMIHGDIKLLKVTDTGKPLAGAKFALLSKSGEVLREATSDVNGEVWFKQVSFGSYQVKEVLSPLGFTKSSQILSAQISEEAQVVDLGKVVNHQIPKTPKLPKTGVSAGILAGSATGLFLLGMVLVRRKRTKLQ